MVEIDFLASDDRAEKGQGKIHLEPCPFSQCADGGPVMNEEYVNGEVDGYFVACCSCGADGPLRESPEEAARAWNER